MNLEVLLLQQPVSEPVFRWSLLLVPIVYALPIVVIVWLIRYLIRAAQERQRLRLEVGKLAEEVHQIRQELKDKEP